MYDVFPFEIVPLHKARHKAYIYRGDENESSTKPVFWS